VATFAKFELKAPVFSNESVEMLPSDSQVTASSLRIACGVHLMHSITLALCTVPHLMLASLMPCDLRCECTDVCLYSTAIALLRHASLSVVKGCYYEAVPRNSELTSETLPLSQSSTLTRNLTLHYW
jgi:hypothetical protein